MESFIKADFSDYILLMVKFCHIKHVGIHFDVASCDSVQDLETVLAARSLFTDYIIWKSCRKYECHQEKSNTI